MTSPVPIKNLLSLLGLSVIFIILILSLNAAKPSLLPGRGELMLTGGFAISALASIIVFFRGAGKNPETSVFATLIALGIKLLLSLVLALLFFLVLKNRDTGSNRFSNIVFYPIFGIHSFCNSYVSQCPEKDVSII